MSKCVSTIATSASDIGCYKKIYLCNISVSYWIKSVKPLGKTNASPQSGLTFQLASEILLIEILTVFTYIYFSRIRQWKARDVTGTCILTARARQRS